MNLRDYLHFKRKSVSEFAKELMVSRNYLSQISLGNIKPSNRLAKAIEQATNGEVTAEELFKENRGDT